MPNASVPAAAPGLPIVDPDRQLLRDLRISIATRIARDIELLDAIDSDPSDAVPLSGIMPSMGRSAASSKVSTGSPKDFHRVYAMVCSGTCLEPTYRDGSKLLFDPTEPYVEGDFVVIYRKPEFVKPGAFQAVVKQLLWEVKPPEPGTDPRDMSDIAPCLVVQMLNPCRSFVIPHREVMAVHKCLGLVPDGVRTRQVPDREMIGRKPTHAPRRVSQ